MEIDELIAKFKPPIKWEYLSNKEKLKIVNDLAIENQNLKSALNERDDTFNQGKLSGWKDCVAYYKIKEGWSRTNVQCNCGDKNKQTTAGCPVHGVTP